MRFQTAITLTRRLIGKSDSALSKALPNDGNRGNECGRNHSQKASRSLVWDQLLNGFRELLKRKKECKLTDAYVDWDRCVLVTNPIAVKKHFASKTN